MKKLIAVPVIAVIAAVGAASAAGFVGGVSAGPIQSGDTWDLTCATSASVVEWGFNDTPASPNVEYAFIKLEGADCQGQALNLLVLNSDGTEKYRATPGRIAAQATGTQYARIEFATPVPVAELNQIRISIDPGYVGMVKILSATNP